MKHMLRALWFATIAAAIWVLGGLYALIYAMKGEDFDACE